MRYNRTRHSLLKKLSEKFLKEKDNPSNQADVIGLTYEEIDLFLKNKKGKRELIFSELEKANEIVFFDLDSKKGCFIELKNGLSALTEKKYLKRNNTIILNWLRNFVQIFIPVASLLITILALSMNIEKNKKVNDEKIEKLELRIEQLEKSLTKKEIEIDSINLN